jgi:hypothetical protein
MRLFRGCMLSALFALLLGSMSLVAPASAAEGYAPDARTKKMWRSTISQDQFGIHSFQTNPQILSGSIRSTCSPLLRDVSPAPGVYDWTKLDQAIDRYIQWGYDDIMLTLCGMPAWLAGDSSKAGWDYFGRGASAEPTSVEAWGKIVGAIADRYKGKIASYQVWNEVTSAGFWSGGVKKLLKMTKEVKKQVNKYDPNALVLSPSVQTHCGDKCFDEVTKPFLKRLKSANWPIDVLTIHGYAEGFNVRYNQFIKFLDVLKKYKPPSSLPIWDTETNHWGGGLSKSEKKAYLPRAFFNSMRLGFERTYWYLWTQDGNGFGDIHLSPGAPVNRSFDTVVEWTVGASIKKCKQSGKLTRCTLTKPGETFDVVYTSKGKATYKTSGKKEACPATGGACKGVKNGKFKASILPHRIG